MAQALIRNLDDDLLAEYRRAAKEHGSSLEAELRAGLRRGRPRRRLSREELVALSLSLQALSPQDVTGDSTSSIRASREEGYGFSS